ncbi:hypothetical protein Cob_v011997 [Colletotrichum orbiculare MAFF 240422]|uniref:Uncharacterized protein n=1 Tax=Colletotrichum orbiculare (strain 104-T / ATCC 96160 / CBS 514.97 / LARS 414 / MAFF 240422) TaxID=1213857 RepID=A0A484FA39_COLOR|nr:hypothetical protein Cob_v011997 [Colletotrichum orbiculare MAFF 240422]
MLAMQEKGKKKTRTLLASGDLALSRPEPIPPIDIQRPGTAQKPDVLSAKSSEPQDVTPNLRQGISTAARLTCVNRGPRLGEPRVPESAVGCKLGDQRKELSEMSSTGASSQRHR